MRHADWLQPEGLPSQVGAVMTTRRGGASGPPWAGLNIGDAVGDAAEAVARNRRCLAEAINALPVYLRQVHGAHVVRLGVQDARAQALPHEADASVTTLPGVACTVQVADCLPVLFAAPQGRAVGAAHAGWRGLAGGVVANALRAVCEAARCEAWEVKVWLGACIGPRQFEVGADVLRAFGADPRRADPQRFAPSPDREGKWLANLPLLARDRLHAAGVRDLGGGEWCTVEDPVRFFSFRRDGVTGRMAAAIWIKG